MIKRAILIIFLIAVLPLAFATSNQMTHVPFEINATFGGGNFTLPNTNGTVNYWWANYLFGDIGGATGHNTYNASYLLVSDFYDTNITDTDTNRTDEQIQDLMFTTIRNGTGILIEYNDAAGFLNITNTVSASGDGSYNATYEGYGENITMLFTNWNNTYNATYLSTYNETYLSTYNSSYMTSGNATFWQMISASAMTPIGAFDILPNGIIDIGNNTDLGRWSKSYINRSDNQFTYSREGLAVQGNAWYDIGGVKNTTLALSTMHIINQFFGNTYYALRGSNLSVTTFQVNNTVSAIEQTYKSLVMENMLAARNNALNGWTFLKGYKNTAFYRYAQPVATSVGQIIAFEPPPEPEYSLHFPYITSRSYRVTFTRPYLNTTIPSVVCTCGFTEQSANWHLRGGLNVCTANNISNYGFTGYCVELDPRDAADPAGTRIQPDGSPIMNWQSMGIEDNGTASQSGQEITEYFQDWA